MATARLDTARQTFEEQLAAFAQRTRLVGTQRYDDLTAQEHYRAFAVAGAMKADLLKDLHGAVERAVVDRTTLADFRAEFRAIVARHGWSGWTGEGTRGGENWRTRTIYTTNIRKSFATGRYAQLTDPAVLAVLPYWRWVHSGLAHDPRPEHVAMHGMTLRHDDPFWQTHFPPRIPPDYGCTCRVEAVRAPAAGAVTEAPAVAADEPRHAPPADVVADIRDFVQQKMATLPPELSRAFGAVVAEYEIGSRGPLPLVPVKAELGRRRGLKDLPPVSVVRVQGDELGARLDDRALRKAAGEFLRPLQRGPGLPNRDTGWLLRINKEGRKKMGNNPEQDRASLLSVAAVEDLTANAVLVEAHRDIAHGNEFVSAIYRFYAAIDIAGVLYRVKLTVKDMTAPDNPAKLLHALVAVEIENAPLGTLPTSANHLALQLAQPTTGRTLSIDQLLAGVQLSDGTPALD